MVYLDDLRALRQYSSYPKPFDLKPLKSRKVVLLVEDDSAMLNFLQSCLKAENYDVVPADDSAMALEWIDRGLVPDLLITDLVMPKMTGLELAKAVRERVPELPVLFETGHTSELFQGQPELDANSAYIEKPFSPRGFIEATRLVLFGTFNPA